MIRIVRKGEHWEAVPELCCDVCLESITVLDLAMLAWFEDIPNQGDSTNLYVIHKGECDKRLQRDKSAHGCFHEIQYGVELLLEHTKRNFYQGTPLDPDK